MTKRTDTEQLPPIDADVPDYPPAAGSAPARRGRRRRLGRMLAAGVVIALLGFGGGIAGFFAADHWLQDEEATVVSATDPIQPSNDTSDAAAGEPAPSADDDSTTLTPREIYRRVGPAIVNISSSISRPSAFFGLPQQSRGSGSGFVIDREGHIVTNAHVVEDAEELKVGFGSDGEVPAELVGLDRSSDIAVLKIDPDAREVRGKLRTVQFGDSRKVQVGDPVLAIGNPFGLDRTLTTGVVSALQRDIPALNDFAISDVIQTDAAVNPGNSGGPLLDMTGRVIGVNSQISTRGGGNDGVAFAVPSSTVQRVVEELIDKGVVVHAWLGVAGHDVTPDIAEALDLPVDEGVIIGQVTKGSPADKAGIEGGARNIVIEGTGVRPGGDILLSFDGEKLTSMRQLAALVDAKQPGDEVVVEFLNDGDRKRATVTLAKRPDSLDAD